MGATFSACATACHNPSSPSDSTTSFLNNTSRPPNTGVPKTSAHSELKTDLDRLTSISDPPTSRSTDNTAEKSDCLWGPSSEYNDESNRSSDETSHTRSEIYRDKYIKDLDECMPPPPLPPRSYKKKLLSSDEDVEPPDDNDRDDLPRIYPIKKNGLKLSDTHYWVIPPRRHHSARDSRSMEKTYLNLPEEHYTEEPTTRSSLRPPETECPLKRGRSENAKEYLRNMQRGQVLRLRSFVPSASEQEAYVVLVGCNWDFDAAVKRLKIELLSRTDLVSRNHCNFLLEQNNWDLDAATRQAKQEYNEWLLLRG